jgi:hypothetical protein
MTEPADTGVGADDPRIRLDALLEQALDLQGDAREAFVAAIESDDAAMAHELRALLRFASDDSDDLQPGRAFTTERWRRRRSPRTHRHMAADTPNRPRRHGHCLSGRA